tara:strand:- start:12761 stop:13669 length:909 start_codon:yes stop_codon:yes gene_type:complete
LISVYITSFNKQKYLSQAIESVLGQTFPPSEIIIVDDASSDNSREIIKGFKSRYPNIVKPIYNEKNLGISETRNIAISNCKNEIITFVDGDDYYFNKKLETEYSTLLKNPSVSCVYSNHVFVDEIGNRNGLFSSSNDHPAHGYIFKENFSRSFYVSSGTNFHNEMFYKSCAQDIGLYDKKIKIWEDWDFRIRASKKYHYAYCRNVNSAYRKLVNGLHNSDPVLHYREQIKIYRKNKHLMDDLKKEEINIICNRIYSQLKGLFISVLKIHLNNGKYFQFVIDLLEFVMTFKMRKAIGYIFRQL